MTEYLIVNFGGPRNLEEISPFLEELLTDRDVIRTRYPNFFHNFLFRRVARKRATKIRPDYELIGGKSPIYFDTEKIKESLKKALRKNVYAFHRYLPETHPDFFMRIENSKADEIKVFPMFPQFSFATTGSIARFFSNRLSRKTLAKLRWIPSYFKERHFIESFQRTIRTFLQREKLSEEDTVLLFSAHGLPQAFVDSGDPYQEECIFSFKAIRSAFPNALTRLSFQSKFGPGEWLRPYTDEVCRDILNWNESRKNVVFIPLSFTTDHIETLFEVEYQYLPILRENNLNAYRCPALNLNSYWIDALIKIINSSQLKATEDLIRK